MHECLLPVLLSGVSYIEKKILIRVKPTWTISVEDDVIIIEVKTSFISFKNHIKLGEEYIVSHLGRKAKVRQNTMDRVE